MLDYGIGIGPQKIKHWSGSKVFELHYHLPDITSLCKYVIQLIEVVT